MNGALCWDCNTTICLFTVQNCGLRKSAESERLDSQLPVIAKWEHIENIYKQENTS